MVDDSKTKNDLTKEVNLICKLKHSNIVGFFGYVSEENKMGIVLEFCKYYFFYFFFFNFKIKGENGTLKNYLNKNKNIPFSKKLNFIFEISKGMEYLHFSNIIHRDLKPDNLLLTNV
jgi:serine/threonine protein kinase